MSIVLSHGRLSIIPRNIRQVSDHPVFNDQLQVLAARIREWLPNSENPSWSGLLVDTPIGPPNAPARGVTQTDFEGTPSAIAPSNRCQPHARCSRDAGG